MELRYSRNVPALSESECEALREKRVAVIGCGGLGGHIMELLCRVGVGQLVLVDGDCFDESNLNRQIISETANMGRNKAICALERVRRINPSVRAEAVSFYLTERNAFEIIEGCDAVMDALDNPASRKLLSRACTAANIPYIYGAISGWTAQAALSMPGDGLIDALFAKDTLVTDKSVLSFTPALCAAVQCSLCVRLLSGREVKSGLVHCFDLLNMELESIQF